MCVHMCMCVRVCVVIFSLTKCLRTMEEVLFKLKGLFLSQVLILLIRKPKTWAGARDT